MKTFLFPILKEYDIWRFGVSKLKFLRKNKIYLKHLKKMEIECLIEMENNGKRKTKVL